VRPGPRRLPPPPWLAAAARQSTTEAPAGGPRTLGLYDEAPLSGWRDAADEVLYAAAVRVFGAAERKAWQRSAGGASRNIFFSQRVDRDSAIVEPQTKETEPCPMKTTK